MGRYRKFQTDYKSKSGYDRNDGLPGVVYILHNEAMRDGVYKIGQSTRSGHARANDLNRAVGTETPKLFKCIFEVRTGDCGGAEKAVHLRLNSHRMTRQEYFDVDLELAKRVITEECANRVCPPVVKHTPPPLARVPPPTAVQPSPAVPAHPQSQPRKSYNAYVFWILAAGCLMLFWPDKQRDPPKTSYKSASTGQHSYLLPGINPANVPPPIAIPRTSPSNATASLAPVPTAQPEFKFTPDRHNPAERIDASVESLATVQPEVKLTPDRHSLTERINSISREEKSSLEAVCLTDKYNNGPAAYNKCREKQLSALNAGPSAPDLTGLTREELSSLEAVCLTDKYNNGPAAYNKCRGKQLSALNAGPSAPDLAGLTREERSSLDAVCATDKYRNGPAALNRCREKQLLALKAGPPAPDLTGLGREERSSLEAVCSADKYRAGPAAYNSCRERQLSLFNTRPVVLDLAGLSREERTSLEAACSSDKYRNGPAAYNKCRARLLTELRK